MFKKYFLLTLGSSGGSSYPKQQWGGSAAGGSNVGGSYPKQQYGSNYGSGDYMIVIAGFSLGTVCNKFCSTF